MNVATKVFSSATHPFSRYHISKNVKARCKLNSKVKSDKPKEACVTIMSAWDVVVASDSGKTYLYLLQNVWATFSYFLKFAENTMLDPVKEKTISTWIDCVMHIENTIINKVEYAHSRMKRYLMDNIGDLCKS